jgi:hypothetical protein
MYLEEDAMFTTEEEIQTLTNQVNDLNVKIAVLAAKQEAAAATARKFAENLDRLRSQQHSLTQQLRELELHKSGMYMWENIGDGG